MQEFLHTSKEEKKGAKMKPPEDTQMINKKKKTLNLTSGGKHTKTCAPQSARNGEL